MPTKNCLFRVFLCFLLLWYILIIFQSYKVIKKSQNSRNQGFSYYFCLMMEGSVSGSVQIWMDPDPGGPITYGSYCFGSGSGSTTLRRTVYLYRKHVNEPAFTCDLMVNIQPILSQLVCWIFSQAQVCVIRPTKRQAGNWQQGLKSCNVA
jgi:hypothetical protein